MNERLRNVERRRLRSWLHLLGLMLTGPVVLRADAGEPPGLLIDAGGFRLHIACEGYGSPAVILDSGLGGTSLEWTAVQHEVRRFTRVCRYDRAGYGWSDPGPRPRTSSRIANELFVLLNNAPVDGPFVLVGHSYGGFNMQQFARRYPYMTAGIVLVDSSHPGQVERFLAPPIGLNTAPSSRSGIVHFAAPPEPHARLPKEVQPLARFQLRRWWTQRTLASELLGFRDSARELRESQALEPMPLVVVSRGKRVWPETRRGDLMEQLWIEMQAELAVQSPYSAHIVARNSGHFIHIEQPDLVAYGIVLVVDLVRARGVNGHVHDAEETGSDRRRIHVDAAAWYRDSLGAAAATRALQPLSYAFAPGAP